MKKGILLAVLIISTLAIGVSAQNSKAPKTTKTSNTMKASNTAAPSKGRTTRRRRRRRRHHTTGKSNSNSAASSMGTKTGNHPKSK